MGAPERTATWRVVPLAQATRLPLVTGVIVDGALLVRSGVTAAREGTPAPVVAQAVRTAGSWGMAWAAAKLGFAVGAAAGIETGPGLALTAIGGGIVGGALVLSVPTASPIWFYED